MTKKLTFSVENIELLEESNNSQFATLKIDAFATGENAHDLYVSEDALRNAAKTILEKPIVWKYSPISDDAMSHEKEECAVGFIPKDTAIDFRTLDDGRIMMSIVGKLWTRYSGKLMEIFQRDKSKSVSVEIEVLEENKKSLYGISEIVAFCFRCITILGQMVRPAIPGAKADLVAFAIQEEQEYQEAYSREFSNKYADVDFTIPKKVKSNAQKSLNEYKEKGVNANSAHLAMARFLTKNEKATPEKIKSMSQFFNRKVNYDDITMGFYGAKAGNEWSKDIMSKIDEIDNKQLSYFAEDNVITFPYSKIEDAPENMKKLDGVSLTLDQINQIAKVADKIGVSKEKNGYAIAKSQFKKSHKIEDGRWVKMSDEEGEIEEFSKEDWGKGKSLSINKSKDKVSETSWGDINKSELKNKILDAGNYKSLVKSAYLLVEEGWQDHPSESLKYPVMQIVDGTLVYNKHALSVALGRAKGQNEAAVVSKVESIMNKLELNSKKKEDNSVKVKKTELIKNAEVKFSLTSAQIVEILNNDLSEFKYGENNWEKYWVYSFDNEYAYVKDSEDGKCYRMKYAIEGLKAEVDTEGKEEVIEGAPLPVAEEKYIPEFAEEIPEEEKKEQEKEGEDKKETPEEEKKEEVEEKKENKEEKMSLDGNLDVSAYLAFLENATDVAEGITDKYKTDGEFDYAKIFSMSKEKMCKMAEDLKKAQEDKDVYMAELENLKKFKKDTEDKQFACELESTFAEVSDVLPKEEVNKFREESVNYSLENIGELQNKIKAVAFSYTGKSKKVDDGITRFALSWVTHDQDKDYSNGWVGKAQ